MKIYVSGKISGLPMKAVEQKFKLYEVFLRHKGYDVVNPLKVSPYDAKKSWNDYMVDDLKALLDCDAIYMLNDWGTSKGARIEYQVAKELGLKIIFQGEFND